MTSGLSTRTRIILAIGAALVLGVAGYLLFGAAVGGVAATVTAIGSWLGIEAENGSLSSQAGKLANEKLRKERAEAKANRARVDQESRDSLAERYIEAEIAAGRIGAGDDGDPNRVLDRHSKRPGTKRDS